MSGCRRGDIFFLYWSSNNSKDNCGDCVLRNRTVQNTKTALESPPLIRWENFPVQINEDGKCSNYMHKLSADQLITFKSLD